MFPGMAGCVPSLQPSQCARFFTDRALLLAVAINPAQSQSIAEDLF